MKRTVRLLPLTLALLLSPLASGQAAPPEVQPAPATAQPAPVAPPAPATVGSLTLAQALASLTQAPGWRGAALQYLSASQSLDAARARAGLSVSAGASVTAAKVPIDGDWTTSTTLNLQAAINVLPWSSSKLSVIQATRALYRAGLDQRDSQNTLALSVVQGYLNAQQAVAALSAAQAQQRLAEQQLTVAQSQQAAGVLTQENLLSAQASQQQAAGAVAEAAGTLDVALRQLYNTLGNVPPTLAGLPVSATSFSSRPAVPAAPAGLDVLLARAAQGRSEILKAASDQSDAQAALAAARLDRLLPDLSVSAQYGQLASTSTGTAGTTVSSGLNLKTGQLTASASLPLNQNSSSGTGTGTTPPTSLALGLSGSFSLLNPVADATTQSAQTAVAAADLSLANARATVDLDVRQKYAGLQNALLGLNAPRTLLARAQTALESARARLQAGLAAPLDVQQAELNVAQAQNTLDAAVNTAYLASLSLGIATAEFSPALIVTPGGVLPAGATQTRTASTGGQP